jgi:hypothetical protein
MDLLLWVSALIAVINIVLALVFLPARVKRDVDYQRDAGT